jgi:hypothetical protein
VELDVDVAAPRTFVGLWVPADGDDRPNRDAVRTVTMLLGPDRARALFDLTGNAGARSLDEGRNDPDEELRQRQRQRFGRGTQPSPSGLHRSLAHLGLATTVLQDPTSSGLARALARLEAATRLSRVGMRNAARSHAEAGAAVLVDRWPDIGDTDPRTLATTLGRVDRLLSPETATDARGLVADLRGRDRRARHVRETVALHAARAPMEAPPAAASARPVARLLQLEVSALPVPLHGREIAARAVRDAEAEIRIHDLAHEADTWWARAFDEDGTMLAAAPFLPVDGDAVVRLLVPPGALHHATYDITDVPGQAPVAPRLQAVVDAVARGQAAARAERLGRPHVAEERWNRSGRSWAEVGDKARSMQAQEYASGMERGRDRIPPPLLADPVVEAGD